MCEFCSRHGDGQIWYRNASNYGRDLLNDLDRRHLIENFFHTTIGEGYNSLLRLEVLYRRKKRLPFSLVAQMVTKAKKEHFGQIIPMEEVEKVVSRADLIVRMPCACRYSASRKEYRCCYGISYSAGHWFRDMDFSYFGSPATDGLEQVSCEEAISQMRRLERGNAVHSIWTMMTPFIGAVCNCTPADCLALRSRALTIETVFPAEHVARVDDGKCIGCGKCLERCQFDAIIHPGPTCSAGKTVSMVKALLRNARQSAGEQLQTAPIKGVTMVQME